MSPTDTETDRSAITSICGIEFRSDLLLVVLQLWLVCLFCLVSFLLLRLHCSHQSHRSGQHTHCYSARILYTQKYPLKISALQKILTHNWSNTSRHAHMHSLLCTASLWRLRPAHVHSGTFLMHRSNFGGMPFLTPLEGWQYSNPDLLGESCALTTEPWQLINSHTEINSTAAPNPLQQTVYLLVIATYNF